MKMSDSQSGRQADPALEGFTSSIVVYFVLSGSVGLCLSFGLFV